MECLHHATGTRVRAWIIWAGIIFDMWVCEKCYLNITLAQLSPLDELSCWWQIRFLSCWCRDSHRCHGRFHGVVCYLKCLWTYRPLVSVEMSVCGFEALAGRGSIFHWLCSEAWWWKRVCELLIFGLMSECRRRKIIMDRRWLKESWTMRLMKLGTQPWHSAHEVWGGSLLTAISER